MPHSTSETDRRLRLIVGLLSLVAATFLVAAATQVKAISVWDWLTVITLTVLIGLSNSLTLRIGPRFNFNWTDSAILVAAATLPPPWLLLSVAVTVTITKFVRSHSPLKVMFAVAKEVILATTAGVIIASSHVQPFSTSDRFGNFPRIELLALAFAAMVLLDHLLSVPVIAISQGDSVFQMYKDGLGRHLSVSVVRFVVALATLALFFFDARLLIAVPPLVLSLHFMHMNRLREQAEREAWHRLARATDALNEVDIDKVLLAAVNAGVAMFGATWVEVEIQLPPARRTAHGDKTGLLTEAPDRSRAQGVPVVVTLEGQRDSADIGELRLFFARPTVLREREGFLLKTFAAALATAIRNATAYGMLTDIADQHAHDAQHDPLTGLANRRRMFDVGAAALEHPASSGTVALVAMDMRQFKEINDGLGYHSGDKVLMEIGRRISEAAGPDALVARQGSDEFAVLFTALPTPALAVHRARQILQAMEPDYELEGVPITLSLRAGLAVAPADGDMAELVRRASLALTEAKRTGERFVPYARSLDNADLDRLELGGQISRAVAAREFTLEFQPIVDLTTGEAVAAEALARWHHPDRGNLDPRRFLDAVERSGQLTAFTEAILDQALSAAGIWAAAGHPIPVAVNVSPRSLLDRRFPALVQEVLEEHGTDPESLILELTESLMLSTMEIVDQVLAELGRMGVAIALDDFGTGFSSLNALARVPVRELKIDRTFVTDMDTAPEALAVVRSTIELGRALGLTVVAEGIERVDQRRTLWDLGCQLGQGHLFARPLSQQRFLATLVKGEFGDALHQPGIAPVVRLPRPADRRRDQIGG
jgi:diguanylate cyclase